MKYVKIVLNVIFHYFQVIGINILPNHFYSNIPYINFLKKNKFWQEPMQMIGVNGLDIKSQIEFTNVIVSSLSDKSILTDNNIINHAVSQELSMGYGEIEADFLYCFINHNKPKKVLQIGCGVSTSIIIRASKDSGNSMQIVCIEPYPSEYLKMLSKKGEIELIEEKAQMVSIDDLINLNQGDLLFIDSTHTVKVGSEVNRIILDVLPRLNKGVFIHFHDIFFPYDYQRNILSTTFFWSESSLLHSFLINNNKFTIRASQSMLHYYAKDFLQNTFPNYNPQSDDNGLDFDNSDDSHFPSSIYLEVVK